MGLFFYRIFCGFFLGISVLAPGVSGSIMAVMMGIYGQLLEIMARPFKNLRRNIVFMIPMGIGAALSLLLFILAFSALFEHYERATYLLFVGLIAGNLPTVWQDARKLGFKKHDPAGMAAGFAITVGVGLLSLLQPESQADAARFPLFYLGLSGFAGGAVALVPGMSISLVLMLFGVYDHLLESARAIDIPVILVTGVCFAAGLALASRLIKLVFDRYGRFANYVVFGILCGSLASVCMSLPGKGGVFRWWQGVLMVALGLGVSLLFVLLSKKFAPVAPARPAGKT
jgi:putative membrane protein